jgi:hypothetical protein
MGNRSKARDSDGEMIKGKGIEIRSDQRERDSDVKTIKGKDIVIGSEQSKVMVMRKRSKAKVL